MAERMNSLVMVAAAVLLFNFQPVSNGVFWGGIVGPGSAVLADEHEEDQEEADGEESEWEEAEEEYLENLKEIMGRVEDSNPGLYEMIYDTGEEEVNEEYIEYTDDLIEVWMELDCEDEDDPVLHRLRMDIIISEVYVDILADKYNDSEEEQKQQYKNDMKKALDRLFDQHIREREYHIQLINEELEELKEKLRSAKENKSEQVRTRLNQLINPTVFD